MNGPQQSPGLEALSDAEKDALILRLREDLQTERSLSRSLEQRLIQTESLAPSAPDKVRPLLARIREAEPTSRARAAKIRLGGRLGVLRSRLVIGALAVGGLLFALDYGIGRYQLSRLEQKRLAELRLERAAYASLFVEVVSVAYEPDHKSYRLKMALQNLDPEHPLYVMLNPIRVFEQAGLVWKEVPARAPNGRAAGIVKLTDRHLFEAIFEPNVEDWTELIPGYMHIRFDNDMSISRRSEPDDDIVARKDPYYIYLKPVDADNEAIRARMNYSGEPPVYIPMPPH